MQSLNMGGFNIERQSAPSVIMPTISEAGEFAGSPDHHFSQEQLQEMKMLDMINKIQMF